MLPVQPPTVAFVGLHDAALDADDQLVSDGTLYLAFENNLAHLDELGSPESYNHYAYGWAHAGNTPFRRWKKETFRGGTTDPFMISWPAKYPGNGELRHQYGHAIDMVPTVLDMLGIEAPDTIKGVEQFDMDGVSLALSFFDDAAADPDRWITVQAVGSVDQVAGEIRRVLDERGAL